MSDLDMRPAAPRSYRHPLQVGPLVFGLVFLGIAAVWALYAAGAVEASAATWLLPAVLVGAGALGVLLAALRPRRSTGTDYAPVGGPYDAWASPGYPAPPATAYDELMAQVPPPDTAPPAADEAEGTRADSYHLDTHPRDRHDDNPEEGASR